MANTVYACILVEKDDEGSKMLFATCFQLRKKR